MRLTFGCVNEDFSTEEYLKREDLFWIWEAPFLSARLLDLIKMKKGEGQLSATIPCHLLLVCQTVRSSSQYSCLCELHHAFPDIVDWLSPEESLSFHNLLQSSYFVTTMKKGRKCKVGPHRKSPQLILVPQKISLLKYPSLLLFPQATCSVRRSTGRIVIFQNLLVAVVSQCQRLQSFFFCDLTPYLKVNKIVFPCPVPLKITIDMLMRKEDLSLSGVSL